MGGPADGGEDSPPSLEAGVGGDGARLTGSHTAGEEREGLLHLHTSLSASLSREASRPSSSDFFCWMSSRSISAVEPASEDALSSWLALLLLPSLSSSQELLCSSTSSEVLWEPGTLRLAPPGL